jgi:sphingosine-1-phosphate phosphatase 1
MFSTLTSAQTVATFQQYCGVRWSKDKSRIVTSTGHDDVKDHVTYTVDNKVLFYLFHFAASFGNEIFFITFFPFWFWNVDGYVGRRLCMFWALFMYLGQGTKDVLKIPRPASPPVIRMELRYELEYGTPSTHAMMGAGIPFTLWLLTLGRYDTSPWLGFTISVVWCSLVCMSRLYLGMHTLWDIIVGLAYVFSLMALCIPYLDTLDAFLLTSAWGPAFSLVTSLILAACYPAKGGTAQADTTLILAVAAGTSLGHWLGYQTGVMHPALLPPPYALDLNSVSWVGVMVRTVVGVACLLVTRVIVKSVTHPLLCWFTSSHSAKPSLLATLATKFLIYGSVAFVAVLVVPLIFSYLGIARESFFYEI